MRRSPAILVAVAALLVASAAAFGQGVSLGVGTKKPVVDGKVDKGEYQLEQAMDVCIIYASRTSDTLYLAYVGDTAGWASLGLGSMGMQGSTMFLGSVSGGKSQFEVHAGVGHRHYGGLPGAITGTVIANSVKQSGQSIVMEIALKSSAYIKAGQTALNLIYASGETTDYAASLHIARGGFPIALK